MFKEKRKIVTQKFPEIYAKTTHVVPEGRSCDRQAGANTVLRRGSRINNVFGDRQYLISSQMDTTAVHLAGG